MNSEIEIVRRETCEDAAAKLMDEGLPSLAARVFAARGIRARSEIAPSLSSLHSPDEIPNLAEFGKLLADAVIAREKIFILGDYDADGMTAAVLAAESIRQMGGECQLRIPNRQEGYGLTPPLAQEAKASGATILMTVDNGISAAEGVKIARELKMKVCITDHHLPGINSPLPDADVIVNPNMPPRNSSGRNLAGVGVAFYAMASLRKELKSRNHKGGDINLIDKMDLVALGTIADSVNLDANNRVFVSQGLARIRAGKCRPGILALFEASNRNCKRATAEDLGFRIAPRINAAGRLSEIDAALNCLLADDYTSAKNAAMRLCELNTRRRDIQSETEAKVLNALSELPKVPSGIALKNDDWHEGVIGIVAARIAERTNRPTVIFTKKTSSDLLKGSARSVDGFDLHRALGNLADEFPTLMEKFGGHKMAAGIVVAEGNWKGFADAFAKHCQDAEKISPRRKITIDGEPAADQLTFDTAAVLEQSIWGEGFPPPQFIGEFKLRSIRETMNGHQMLTLGKDGMQFGGIQFKGNSPSKALSVGKNIRAVYRVVADEFNGVRRARLLIKSVL